MLGRGTSDTSTASTHESEPPQKRVHLPERDCETPVDACNYMRRVFVPALEVAEVENFQWHDLRHTFRESPHHGWRQLADRAGAHGHKTITMNLRYAHLSPAHQPRGSAVSQ